MPRNVCVSIALKAAPSQCGYPAIYGVVGSNTTALNATVSNPFPTRIALACCCVKSRCVYVWVHGACTALLPGVHVRDACSIKPANTWSPLTKLTSCGVIFRQPLALTASPSC